MLTYFYLKLIYSNSFHFWQTALESFLLLFQSIFIYQESYSGQLCDGLVLRSSQSAQCLWVKRRRAFSQTHIGRCAWQYLLLSHLNWLQLSDWTLHSVAHTVNTSPTCEDIIMDLYPAKNHNVKNLYFYISANDITIVWIVLQDKGCMAESIIQKLVSRFVYILKLLV